jgi:hypothetical protein
MAPLVEFSTERQAPDHVVEGLRSIDATADLLFWGPRLAEIEQPSGLLVNVVFPVWLLGTVRPNGIRRRVGARLLRTQELLGVRGHRDTWRYGKLLYQGFAPVAFYPAREPGDLLIEDFRKRDWLFRNALQAEAQRAMAESEGAPQLELRVKKMIDKVHSEGLGLWKFAFAGRRSFVVN